MARGCQDHPTQFSFPVLVFLSFCLYIANCLLGAILNFVPCKLGNLNYFAPVLCGWNLGSLFAFELWIIFTTINGNEIEEEKFGLQIERKGLSISFSWCFCNLCVGQDIFFFFACVCRERKSSIGSDRKSTRLNSSH